MLNYLLVSLLAWYGFWTVLLLPYWTGYPPRLTALATIDVFLGAAFVALRSQKFETACRIYLAGIWVYATLVAAQNGGIRSPIVGLYLMLPVSAAWLLGQRASMWTAALSVASAFVFAAIETAGVELPRTIPGTPIGIWIQLAATVLMTVLPLAQVLRTAMEAMAERDSADRLVRAIIDSSPDPIFVKDAGARFILANAAALDVLNATADQALGRTVEEIYEDPDAGRPMTANDREVMATGHTHFFEETAPGRAGEGARVFQSAKTPHRDARGRVIGVIGISREITDRKRAENALRESEQMFATLFRRNPASMTISDPALGDLFLDVNDAFEEITGYSREEAVGKTHSANAIWVDETEYQRAEVILAREGRLRNFEFQFRRKDGNIRTGLLSVELVEVNGRPCVFGMTIDITDRKRANEERDRLNKELAHAQKMESVGRFAGGVAHDFNNLMSVVLMYADSAREELQAGESPADSIREIGDAADRAIAIGRQLMALSSKQPIQPEVLDLNRVLADGRKLLQRLMGADVRIIMTPESRGLVNADLGQVWHVIMNLAVNARDAMPTGGSFTLETADAILGRADVDLPPDAEPGAYVVLRVRDTGVGMDSETRARAFEPFFTTKEMGKGTGLGLSVVHGIVKQWGGFVTMTSEPGGGTEFRMCVPAVAEEQAAATEAGCDRANGGSETILLAEDEPALRNKMREVLTTAGYKVLAAENGVEALHSSNAHEGRIDLVVTDIVMPEVSGVELTARLAALRPDAKVLYVSGHPELGDGGARLDPRRNFLRKPFTSAMLLQRVREVLDGAADWG